MCSAWALLLSFSFLEHLLFLPLPFFSSFLEHLLFLPLPLFSSFPERLHFLPLPFFSSFLEHLPFLPFPCFSSFLEHLIFPPCPSSLPSLQTFTVCPGSATKVLSRRATVTLVAEPGNQVFQVTREWWQINQVCFQVDRQGRHFIQKNSNLATGTTLNSKEFKLSGRHDT